MKGMLFFAALTLLLSSNTGLAGEFRNYCANGLANYNALVKTDCSVNWTDGRTGKTYCFSSENSMEEFLEDIVTNTEKATGNFAEIDQD